MGGEAAAPGGATNQRAPSGLRVGDLIEVAAVRPVVRLADLSVPELRADLARAFVLSDDARHVLATVLGDIRTGRGRGYVLEGHYGAGKSHLLAVLHGLASGALADEQLGAGLREGGDGGPGRWQMPRSPSRPLTVAISLLEHAAREPLEAIVLQAVAAGLVTCPAPDNVGSRRDTWEAAATQARAAGYAGILLCLDELGEFLQAKPDARAFAEDVRFLQYLGEWAAGAPAWVVLGVQEALEQAGDLPATVGAGLRDRFAVRFRLGAGHITELVARRLIRQRSGAGSQIERLGAEFARTFGSVPGGAEALARVYPVHPLTIDLLDRLRPLFSQRRGVVDFVASRLAGDPARRIPPWLDRPAERLLGPERLVDHFRDRIRERPDTAPLVDQALDYFERDLTGVFRDAEMAALARRLGKILIAGALCPTPMSFTVPELTLALAHRFSGLDPAVNRECVADLAERLATAGAYVGCAEEPAAGSPGSVRRYRCDLRADLHPILRNRVAAQRRTLSLADGRLWRALLPVCEDPAVPLAKMGQERGTPWEVSWRHTPRQVVCRVVAPDAFTPAAVAGWMRELEDGLEVDALLLVLWGAPADAAAALSTWVTHCANRPPATPVLVWAPRTLGPAEGQALLQLGAHLRVQAELDGDFTDVGRRLKEHLQGARAEIRRRVGGLIRDIYLQGRVVGPDGASRRPVDLGPHPFVPLLSRLVDAPLTHRYPGHPAFAAAAGRVSEEALVAAVSRLLRGADPGSPGSPEEGAVAGLLAPLGLCRRDARGWRLTATDEAGPLAAALTGLLEGSDREHPVPVGAVYARLRKGPGGLTRFAFGALCFTLARVGEVSLRRRGRRLSPDQVTPERVWEVDGCFRGALLDREWRPVLRALPMLPPELRSAALSHGGQRAAWQALCAWRRDWEASILHVREQAARAMRTAGAASLVTPERMRALDELVGLLPSVAFSLSPEEGLARFCRTMAEHPDGGLVVERAGELKSLLAERLDAFAHMAAYLDAPDFAAWNADLEATARTLRAALRDPESGGSGGWARLTLDFAAFRVEYARAYRAEHAAAVEPTAFTDYQRVLDSPEMGLARRLAGLQQSTGRADAAAIEALAAEALGARCDTDPAALEERLRHVPGCRCGFVPGRQTWVSARRLGELAHDLASAVLAALGSAEVAGRLEACASDLSPEAANALGRLRAVRPNMADAASQALTHLTGLGPAAQWVLEAASGRRLDGTLDLGELEDTLCGRMWDPVDLRSAITQWASSVGACRRVQIRPPASSIRPARGRSLAGWAEAYAALGAAADRPPADGPGWAALWSGPVGCWQRRYAEAKAVGGGPEAEAVKAGEWATRLEGAFRTGPGCTAPREGLLPVGRELDRLAAAGNVFAFCVDALRCDLMEVLLDEVARQSRLRVRERGVAWAVDPTVTETQFDAWARQGYPVALARQDGGTAAAIARVGRDALARASWSAGRCVCKWDFLDHRLHEADVEFGLLAAEFRLQARHLLLPALACLGPGDAAVVFGDHGFRSRASAVGWRYTHGGDSPDEVLTPWCVLG